MLAGRAVRYNTYMSADDDFSSITSLPVYERQADILASVDSHQVTILTAETGAGKSTQVPQFLAEHGYTKVIVTQPRILAARNLSNRVKQEYSWRMGRDCTNLVGYRTAHERDDSEDTVILYCTDGLQLVRELTGSGTRDKQVLILDEVHEWNENMEVLVAWSRKRCQEDPGFKLVIMSATIETADLAAYFNAAPPISIAGRSFPVSKRFGSDIVTEIHERLDADPGNMLVFLPGKAEIEAVADAVSGVAQHRNVPVIPLHSQLEPADQQLAFGHYPGGKIVLTTNIAQTSVTIDDIDTVIDSGLERRSEVRSGVEGLFISQISQADCLQRAGRAGRTKPGAYILARLGSMPCQPLEERPQYGVPEILRKHIDRLVLRLANISIDIEDLEFFHSPSRGAIKFAKRTLVSLGAIGKDGLVTPLGRKMERFPVESTYARMLVESEQYADPVRAKLAAIIAIQEVGGIVKGSTKYSGWRRYTRHTRSDLLAQYDVLLAFPSIPADEYEDLGIISKNIAKAEEIITRLNHDLGIAEVPLESIGQDEIPQLLRCIVAGQLHQLWSVEPSGEATHLSSRTVREISGGTVVRQAGLVAGTPFDLQVPTPQGLETLHLVNDLTAVDPEWLEDLSPDSFKVSGGKAYFDARYGTMAETRIIRYKGRLFEASSSPLLEQTPENRKLFTRLYAEHLHAQLEKERQLLQMLNHRRIPVIKLQQVQDRVRHLADGAVSAVELSKQDRIELSKLAKLESFLGADFMAGLHTASKGRHAGPSHKREAWKHQQRRRYPRRGY